MHFQTNSIETYELKPLSAEQVRLPHAAKSRHAARKAGRLWIGRTHLLGDCQMAELLDDRNELVVVLPLADARRVLCGATAGR